MTRRALALLAACIAAVALCAQPVPTSTQEAERARQLLQSSQWVDKAWGAYLAGRLHSADLDELLVEEFRTAAVLRSSPYWSEEHAYVYVLFDAAVEAGIAVPAELLDPFKEDWTAPVVILLARGNDSEDLLLGLSGDEGQGTAWLAANNLLFGMKSQRWFAGILRDVKITHRFTVTDQAYGPGFGGGVGGGYYGDGVAAMPKGFPPVTLYQLDDHAQRGSVMLAHGPQDVYYNRTVVPTDKQVGNGSHGGNLNRASIRIGYLAEMANITRDKAEEIVHADTQIRYNGTAEFQRQADQSMEAQRQRILQLLEDAKQRGFSAPDVRLRIVPEVDDQRKDATEPLPPVAEREIAFN